ncbi:class I SAM-dependent methyltransferase, partial [Nocardioides szechwanensis]|uniref:class I SAM-dependent methyltransferase n=1 Tax=Nocardioides szechwanensis TaxID=1005944 RepID=UPI0011BEB2DB
PRRSRTALWVRSWLAIYDLDDLVALDAPWWTFEAADAVEHFLAGRRGARVFEWGSGASTVWLSRRGAVVHSVEHDAAWAELMADVLPPSATLRLVPAVLAGHPGTPPGARSAKPGFEELDFAAYVAAIDDVPGPLDLVVIDGRARSACLDRAIGRLAPGGLIVLDNVERARYRAALARHGADLDVRWTRGRTPTLPYPTRTALVSRRTAPA